VLEQLVDFCEATPLVTSLSVGCSLGRGAADALSDVDAAIGLAAPVGPAGAGRVLAAEDALVALLPRMGPVVDVLRQRLGRPDRFVRGLFAQFADGTQLDVAVMAEADVRRGRAAPDFVSLYRTPPAHASLLEAAASPHDADVAVAEGFPPADEVSAQQVREWAFLGWRILGDADKHLRRGSLWEAHQRLHEARGHIWALWAAARGALYPWHGLSQVLDLDPHDLPPGIEDTVAGLVAEDLRRAVRTSADVLSSVSALAADRCDAELPAAMGSYVSHLLTAAARP
jgi:hypothetical protein